MDLKQVLAQHFDRLFFEEKMVFYFAVARKCLQPWYWFYLPAQIFGMSGLDNRLYIYHSQILCWAVGEGNKENKALYSPRAVPEVKCPVEPADKIFS